MAPGLRVNSHNDQKININVAIRKIRKQKLINVFRYWYNNGCLFPDMMTVFIPLDPCKKENGCLQVS